MNSKPGVNSKLSSLGMTLALALALGLGMGCSSVSPLVRAQSAYDEARYENAVVWLDEIAPHGADADNLALHDRVRFHFLRGMTEHRLGHRTQALHHLALAREIAGTESIGLRHEQSELLARSLFELESGHSAAEPAAAAAPEPAEPTTQAETPPTPPAPAQPVQPAQPASTTPRAAPQRTLEEIENERPPAARRR